MGIKKTQELKQLQTRLAKANVDWRAAREETKAAQKKESQIYNQIVDIENKIQLLLEEAKDPIITEHALLRYFERVKGFDLEAIRSEILNEKTTELIKEFKSGKFPVNGYRVVVKKGTVTTIET